MRACRQPLHPLTQMVAIELAIELALQCVLLHRAVGREAEDRGAGDVGGLGRGEGGEYKRNKNRETAHQISLTANWQPNCSAQFSSGGRTRRRPFSAVTIAPAASSLPCSTTISWHVRA